MIVRTMYETADGKIFEDMENAKEHENELIREAENNKVMECIEIIKEYCKSGCSDCILANFCSKEFVGMPADWEI